MPNPRLVTGTHTFTFPYRIDGGIAAEFECRCTYTVYLGRPAIHSPPPGEPPEPDEIRDITDIEAEVTELIPPDEYKGGPPLRGRWIEPDDALKEKIEQYLDNEGAQDLIEEANIAGVEA